MARRAALARACSAPLKDEGRCARNMQGEVDAAIVRDVPKTEGLGGSGTFSRTGARGRAEDRRHRPGGGRRSRRASNRGSVDRQPSACGPGRVPGEPERVHGILFEVRGWTATRGITKSGCGCGGPRSEADPQGSLRRSLFTMRWLNSRNTSPYFPTAMWCARVAWAMAWRASGESSLSAWIWSRRLYSATAA
jgi:hypothetical protein